MTMQQLRNRTYWRIARYLLATFAKVIGMLAISIFITVIVINMGGYVDDIARGDISEAMGEVARKLLQEGVPEAERLQILKRAEWRMEEYAGLHAPFLFRCVQWWYHAITFDWGDTDFAVLTANTSPPTDDLRAVIAERISITLLLAGTSNLILFISIILFSLYLSRRNGTWIDKLMRSLAPLSAAPNWVYGIILVSIFTFGLKILPAGNMVDGQAIRSFVGGWLYLVRYVQTDWEFFLNIAKHMVLPVLSIFMATFFQGVFVWRTFFLIYSEEDYVEMARAKGLPSGILERKYILRPTLPPILTSLTMMLVSFWEGTIALEIIFNWPGIGHLFLNAGFGGNSVQLSVVVVFAYLLALSVLLLDIAYVLVDPRISLISQQKKKSRIASRTLRTQPIRTDWKSVLRQMPLDNPPTQLQHKKTFKQRWAEISASIRDTFHPVQTVIRELQQTKSGKLGIGIISFLALLAFAGFIINVTGYQQKNYAPAYAVPVWVNWFRKNDLPASIFLDTRDGSAAKDVVVNADGSVDTTIEFVVAFPYTDFPQDVTVVFEAQYTQIRPRLQMVWIRPDGTEVEIVDGILTHKTYSLDNTLAEAGKANIWGIGYGVYPPMQTLFEDKEQAEPTALPGTYRLLITSKSYESETNLDASLAIPGKVYGIAGTDGLGGDMALLLISSTPLTLLYGILGAVGVNLGAMLLAAIAVTWGGLPDNIIQRLTEIKILLPTLPLVVMIALLYTDNTWIILGILILINIFGSVLKEYRAVFLQAKESIYVEAAQAYGASRIRIITHYLLPRIITMLIPQLVIGIPAYSFLQATLTFLTSYGFSSLGAGMTGGLTWGSLLAANLNAVQYDGVIHVLLEPAILLFLIGLGFALVGFNLESIINPRLRKY